MNLVTFHRTKNRFISDQDYQDWILTLGGEIEALNNRISTIESTARDWRKVANGVFAFARYAKEDFDSGDLLVIWNSNSIS